MMTASRLALVAAISLTVVSAAAAQDAPAAEAMGKAPTWLNLVASILCGLVTIGVVLVAAAAGFLLAHRGAVNSRQIVELREEIARLREEIEHLKKGPSATGSTDIKAV